MAEKLSSISATELWCERRDPALLRKSCILVGPMLCIRHPTSDFEAENSSPNCFLNASHPLNLILPPEEANIRLAKCGMLHKNYLMKHKKALFTTLLTQGKLYQHCAEIEKQARDMFDNLVEQMKQTESVTEQLKEKNQLEWVCCMQNIEARAREIVTTELIYI